MPIGSEEAMRIYDFDNIRTNDMFYGGNACRKIGAVIDGQNYMLKFPGNLKARQMKNVLLSYSHSSVSEYLGSHIYELLGIPVHETLLGRRGGKLVVACKDFTYPSYTLKHFSEAKMSMEELEDTVTGDGENCDLEELRMILSAHPVLNQIEGVGERFWGMFIVDALIGNPDRNNNNWGFLFKNGKIAALAPVFDNGNCLFNKWDDAKIQTVLDRGDLDLYALRAVTNIFTLNGKQVNPFQVISSGKYPECTDALLRIVPKINIKAIQSLISDMCDAGAISAAQREFYSLTIDRRYSGFLLKEYKKAREETLTAQLQYREI